MLCNADSTAHQQITSDFCCGLREGMCGGYRRAREGRERRKGTERQGQS
jgi:hypothetical protein